MVTFTRNNRGEFNLKFTWNSFFLIYNSEQDRPNTFEKLMTFQYRNGTFFLGKKRGLCSNQTYFGAKQSKFKMMLRNTRPKLATVLCKSNESVIRTNSLISGLFNEKCLRFIHLESSKKIQRIFPLPIVLVHTNFRAASR